MVQAWQNEEIGLTWAKHKIIINKKNKKRSIPYSFYIENHQNIADVLCYIETVT